MLEIPECLSRRYKALDDLIQELKSSQPSNPNAESASTDDPGIKMMCDFWSILKEDPDVDLTQAVQQRMRANGVRSGMFGSQHVSCFRSGCCDNDDKIQKTLKKIKKVSNESPGEKSQCGTSKSATSSTMSQNNIPLNKVLCNLKEAASFEKKCHGKVNKLQERQKELQEQIQLLEQREKDGVTLLKQADCMWSCMEEAYKKKIAESLERQNDLLKQLKEAESSNVKWRKNKKDLEFQINIINKCYQEIQEKINEKTSDIKCINMEIENLKKRIESNKTDLEAAKKSFGPKKQASDAKMKSIAAQVTKLEKSINEEKKHKLAKEREGSKYIKEAREELQKLCKVLLQKKLENEDLKAEGEVVMCPHKDSTPCGPDCAMHSIPNAVGSEVAAWRPSPCRGPTCQFTNMRAAQCVLGPEILTSARDPITQPPFSPTTSILDDQVACRCSGVPQIPCICHKDSKQMKVEIPISCDKETYAVGQKSVVFQQINEDTDKFNIDNIPVQETHSKLVNNEQKVTIRSIKNVLDNVSPIVTKTSSGELEVALDKEIVKLIDKKMQDSPNLSVEFNNNKVLAKKSPSGNIILEFDKKAKKKCLLHFEKSLNKVKTQSCNSDKNLSQKKLTKIILDTTNKKISGCKTRSKNITNFFKVTVKSNNHTANELVLALRQTDSGVYEVILDKEFKKWYKQAINDHCLGTEDEYARIERTSSGNFILNFGIDDQDYSESKYALLVKSHSGNNIKIVVDEQESKFEIMKKKFGSTISLRALSGLLNKLTYSNEEIQRKDSKKSRTISTKSSSDSNVYEKVKFDINNNQNLIESEAVLKKSESGKYTVVLNKESKSAFINNLGKTISSSSKGLIPIKQTVSGNITVSLNTDLTSQYGSLKITKSGNMYVLLNKNKAKGISTINESLDNKNVNKGTKLYQNSNQTKTVTSKATTTSCKGQCKENSCNESKCICDSISYDSKECVIENAEIFFENKEFANNTKDKDFISKDKLIKNLPHIVIKPCGCRSTSEKFTIDRNYNKVQSTRCPGHIDRYQELSNEILEISNPCQRDLDDIEKNEKTVKNRIVTHDNKKIDDWDSLQFLPPQLPPFLKDYSLL
ncbi:myosin-2 heavy chain-like isoform X3 [Maniola jurtina]|uniref:myosin-2 heavy chain-like isoform X3 n=1 Tax=Maniola jurtina TaxID=191418 RepID=UPI001E68F670|nr:myosin-2 heavy chain-like isoform X3 [Maniola jurtina]